LTKKLKTFIINLIKDKRQRMRIVHVWKFKREHGWCKCLFKALRSSSGACIWK